MLNECTEYWYWPKIGPPLQIYLNREIRPYWKKDKLT
jgi:hypothetical protein